MGNTMQSFPVMMDISAAQKQTMRDLNVIVNQLGMRVIEIEQINPNARNVVGVMVCRYKERPQNEIERISQQMGKMPAPAELYPYNIDGGSIEFAESPFPRMMKGTGKVAFLLDDSEPTPAGALSGAKTGWNREFLASHYYDGFWRVVEEEDDREIRARAQNIMKRRDEIARENGQQPIAYRPGMKMPMVRGDRTLITNPDPGVSVPSSLAKDGEQEFGGTLSGGAITEGVIPDGPVADPVHIAESNTALQKILLEQGETIKRLTEELAARKPRGRKAHRTKTPKGVDGGFEE